MPNEEINISSPLPDIDGRLTRHICGARRITYYKLLTVSKTPDPRRWFRWVRSYRMLRDGSDVLFLLGYSYNLGFPAPWLT